MNNTEQKYTEASQIIRDGLMASDDMKIAIAPHLFKMQNLFNNLATGSVLANQYSSFNDYLLQELGRSKRRVMNLLRIGQYIIKFDIKYDDLFGIQLPLLELVAKYDIPYSDKILDLLRTHDYKTLEVILQNEYKQIEEEA